MEENSGLSCVNCERSEAQAPLLAVRFNGEQSWICSQCLPVLIHHPQRLTGKLPGIEMLPGQAEEH